MTACLRVRLASLDTIILMSPTELDVVVWSRGEARQWQRKRYQSRDVIPLPSLAASLPLAVLYDGCQIPGAALIQNLPSTHSEGQGE